MKLRELSTALVAAGLVLAPVAAQAGTRASDEGVSKASVSSVAAPRATKPVKKDKGLTRIGVGGVLLGFAAVGGIGCLAFCSSGSNAAVSRGF